jgi:hypothetical protein
MTASPYVLLDDSLTQGGRSLLYVEPERVVSASSPEEVDAALDEVSAGLARGLHAAGFFSYELGYCLEPRILARGAATRRRALHRARRHVLPLAAEEELRRQRQNVEVGRADQSAIGHALLAPE